MDCTDLVVKKQATYERAESEKEGVLEEGYPNSELDISAINTLYFIFDLHGNEHWLTVRAIHSREAVPK